MKLIDLKLSKEYLFDRISQEDIFEYYLGFPVKEGFHKNPLREDKTPGCKFYYAGEYLIFNDFAWKKFNCFEFVMQKYGLDYRGALKKIAADLLGGSSTPVNPKLYQRVRFNDEKIDIPFKIKHKDFTPKELAFWNIGGIKVTQEMLQAGGIYSVHTLWEDGYVNTNLEMVFAFVEDGMIKQIYFPENKKIGKRRFRNKKDFKVGGWSQMDQTARYVVVTKSFKDRFFLRLFGVNTIYIVNEKILLDKEYMDTLASMYDFIGFLLDNDFTGKRQLIHYKQTYPDITPMLFSCDEGKDTYDVTERFGGNYMMDLIEHTKQLFL